MGKKVSINAKLRQLGTTRTTTYLLTGVDIDGEWPVLKRAARRREAAAYIKAFETLYGVVRASFAKGGPGYAEDVLEDLLGPLKPSET